ncbi:MAG: dockerin type I domain-containing protein [Planctomycetota bacterium]
MTRIDFQATGKRIVATMFLVAATCVAPASAEVFINEIFFDPGGAGNDQRDEFIELRGQPGMSLDNHYLIFLENEDNSTNTGPAGRIDNIFDLNGQTLGSNGFLVFRQGGNLTGDLTDSGPSRYSVVPGATDLVNTGSGPGFGSGPGSTIGAQDFGGEGAIENGGFTAFLIRNDDGVPPELNDDLDVGNDGLDHPQGQEGWQILDGIGVFEPLETFFGRAYAQINYGAEEIGELGFIEGSIRAADPGLEPGAEYFGIGYEIEYLGRWGNSTGRTNADWHISNLTDNPGAGALSPPDIPNGSPIDFRQSFTGDHSDLASGSQSMPPRQPSVLFPDGEEILESNQAVPYGTPLLTNVGGPNYLTGDYNGDGFVDTADYTVWRDTLGATSTELAQQPADANRDFVVDSDDYLIWRDAFGAPNFAAEALAPVATPEPGQAVLFGCVLALGRRRRS